MSSDGGRRIALDPEVSTDNVDSASWDLKWVFTGTLERGDGNFKEDQYRPRDDKETGIHLVHDELIDMRYLIVRGPGTDAVVKAIPEHLKTVDAADAKRRYEQADSAKDRVTALYLQAIAAKSGTVPATFKDALADDDADVRTGAIVALGYIGGEEAQALVDAAAEDDPSDAVREEAASMAKTMREFPQPPA